MACAVLFRTCLLFPEKQNCPLLRSPCTRSPISWSAFPHFTRITSKAQRRRSLNQGHTGIGLSAGRRAASGTAGVGGWVSLRLGPPRGGAGPSPSCSPAPEGRPGGRAEEVSAAGRNASGRGAAARGSGAARQAAGAAGPSARHASLHRGAGGRAEARRL